MPSRFLIAGISGAALIAAAVSAAPWALGTSSGEILIAGAQAQPKLPPLPGLPDGAKLPEPLDKARTAVQSLIAKLRGSDLPEGIVRTNGRLEATQVDVSAKYPGRLATLTVDEGDEVTAGQVVGTISSPETEAQLRSAQAQVLKAKQGLSAATAQIAQRKAEVDAARPDYERGMKLMQTGNITAQLLDQRRNRLDQAEAAYITANDQRDQAESEIKAATAEVERLQAILADLTLYSPRSGRVQYRLARAGEVVGAGQRVVTILDLNDVYMTVYLPADVAGRLTVGDEARHILDPIPQYVLPATVSFVATESQFTPKSVETVEERQKLMFRVKLQADPALLAKYHRAVKTGVRGLGFVRTDPKIPWPPELDVKIPDDQPRN
jgi:HlyD family secretion protein